MIQSRNLSAILLALLLAAAVSADAQVTIVSGDKVVFDKFLEHTQRDVDLLSKEHFAQIKIPENLCWMDFPKLGMALTAYELTGHLAHLRSFVKAFENMRSTVKRGPDGFLGWYGEVEPSLNGRFIAPALAPFDQRIGDLLYTGQSQAMRVEKSGDAWQGGVLAGDWLLGKYVLSARAKDGQQAYRKYGSQFLQKKDNAEFAKSLQFEVKPPGYKTPAAPPDAAADLGVNEQEVAL